MAGLWRHVGRTTSGVVVGVVGIGQLRGYTLSYVERAASGEDFDVLRRGKPVARLDAASDYRHLVIPVRLKEFRLRTPYFIDRVLAGDTIAIEWQGRTVAALRPITGTDHTPVDSSCQSGAPAVGPRRPGGVSAAYAPEAGRISALSDRSHD